MGRWVNCRGNIFPFLGMVMAMLAQSGSMVVIKVAMTDGINKYVMVVYSLALSTILLLPFALFLHRFSFLFSLFSSSFYLLHYMEGNVSSLFERTKFNRNIFCIIPLFHLQVRASSSHILCTLQFLLACILWVGITSITIIL